MKAGRGTNITAPACGAIAALLDDNAADHPIPIMIGASQVVCARLARGQENIFALTRLHHDLGALVIEHVGIVDFGGGEKYRRGEFVGFFAVVLKVQTIVHVVLEGEVIGHELVVDHGDIHGDRVGRGSAGTHSKHDQQTQCCDIPNHKSHPLGRRPYRRFLVEQNFCDLAALNLAAVLASLNEHMFGRKIPPVVCE